ncbi:chemotaxis protein CheX [Gammaproteobacteria bacterium 45_16_T64]|nr:chemotaxis protein CheX [Gammaproteobacteria bacterium 45_16_T64]
MNIDFINPFLQSMSNVIATMASIESVQGEVSLKLDDVAHGDVTGLIGMVGEKTKGSLAISFKKEVILDITSRMLGETITEINDDVLDCVGEITNMVTGGAKNLLAEKGFDFDLATPVVINGESHDVVHKFKGNKITIPFSTEYGDFFVEICFEDIK